MNKIISRYLFALALQMFFFINLNGQNITSELINVCNINTPDGAIHLTVNDVDINNPSPFQFIWTDQDENEILNETNQDGISELLNLSLGEYCVEVINGDGCRAAGCFNIENISDPNFAIQINNVDCICPGGEGTIDISITGDSGPYTFFWTSPDGEPGDEEDFITNELGLHIIIVTNSLGCTVGEELSVYSCNFDFEDFDVEVSNSCDGGNSGSIRVEASNVGGLPYSFIWSDDSGIILQDISANGIGMIDGLSEGIYNLTVLTSNGCEANSYDLIIEGPFFAPEIDYLISPETVAGNQDGSIELNLTGGSTPFTFLWSNGATTQSIYNLSYGAYSVEIFYGIECMAELQFNLTNCENLDGQIDLSHSITPMTTNLNDAAIDLTIENPDGYGFNFNWLKVGYPLFSANTEDINSLDEGTYCVVISHPVCSDVQTQKCFTICNFGLELKSGTLNDCLGTTLKAFPLSNSNMQFSFLWSNGSTDQQIDVLYDQEYCVTVFDNSGCQASLCTTVSLPPLELELAVEDVVLGGSNGNVTASVSGGFISEPYSYQWNTGSSSHKIINLPTGEYSVTVTDYCGNTISSSATVYCEINNNLVEADISQPSCSGNSSLGEIDLEVYVSNNSYLWNNGETTEDLADLIAGEYCVTITNIPTNCEYTECFTIDANTKSDFDFDFEITPGCLGGSEGSITAYVNEGFGDYTYIWRRGFGGLEVLSNEQTLENASPDWYVVIATDDLGCFDYEYVFLPISLNSVNFDVTLSSTQICPTDEFVTASIENITGGQEPYEYAWRSYPSYQLISEEQTTDISSAGWYIIEVIGDAGCHTEQVIYVGTSSLQISGANIENVCGNNPGSIEVLTLGGVEPLAYLWETNETNPILSVSSGGEYSVTVTDAVGCTVTVSSLIVEEGQNVGIWPISPNLSQSNTPICPGANNGFIEPVVTGTNPYPISYEWSNGTTEKDIYSLTAGAYTLTATNGAGCSDEYTFEILESYLNVSLQDLGGSAPNLSIGFIDIEPYSGSAAEPYTYEWSNGATTQDITTLSSGNYTVTITDVNGCTYSESYFVPQCGVSGYTPISISTSVVPATTEPPSNDGQIEVTISGGIGPYNIEWTNPNNPDFFITENTYQTTISLTNLAPGDYFINVTDGCSEDKGWRPIRRCKDLYLELENHVDICPDGNNPGSITMSVNGSDYSGLIPPYEYRWSKLSNLGNDINLEIGESNSNTITLSDITSGGIYCLYVTTYAGCEIERECHQIIKTFDVNRNPDANGQCSYTYSCPGGDSNTITEDLEFVLTGPDTDERCRAYIHCPFEELNPFDYDPNMTILGQEYWVEDGPPDNNGYCPAYLVCGFESFLGTVYIEVLNEQALLPCDQLDDIIIDGGGDGDSGDNECPGCIGSCTYTYNDDCTYNEVCVQTGTIVSENNLTSYDLCIEYVNANGFCGYNIWEYCPKDCDDLINVIFVCDNDQTVCNETPLNNAIDDYGYSVDCSSGSCCAELTNVFEICEPCTGFLSDEELEKLQESEDEWLESFRNKKLISDNLNVKISPNPFTKSFWAKIDVSSSSKVNITMVDILGKEILNQTHFIYKGTNTIEFSDLQNLNTGVYQVFVIDEYGNQAIQKVVYQSE